MTTRSSVDLFASSVQRTILGVLIVVLWITLGMTVPSALGGGTLGTAVFIPLTVVIAEAIVALFVEGYREGEGR